MRPSKILTLLLLFISPSASASAGSALIFSLFMFVFFILVAVVFFKITTFYTKRMKSKILSKVLRVFSVALFISPTVYFEDGKFMFLPSAVVLQIGGAYLSALGSILITSVGIYLYLSRER